MQFAYALLLVGLVAACGDNEVECGPGTTNVGNLCTPVPSGGSAVTCGDGTVLDPATGSCEIDANACKDGTVLINDACMDPTAALTIDVEEGPEPNGLDQLGESSSAPAGLIHALKSVGATGLVIHGHITPFQDANHDGELDADVDTYLLDVAQPTFVRITGAGVHGLSAAIAMAANGKPELTAWERASLNVGGTTSQRELFIPEAGEYFLSITDARSLYDQLLGVPPNATGGPDAEYFVTIDQLDLPTPTGLAVTNGVATTTKTIDSKTTDFFSLPMDTGLDEISLTMPSIESFGSVIVLRNGAFKGTAVSDILTAGFQAGDDALVIVDPTYVTSLGAVPFTLTVHTGDAVRLPSDGSALAPVVEGSNTPLVFNSDLVGYNAFFVDAGTSDVIAIDLTWTHAVRGQLLDDNAQLAATFTGYDASEPTWTHYTGLVRVVRPGRYYFVVYDPTGTPGTTTLGAGATVTQVGATAITEGTPTDPTDIDPIFTTTVFSYDAGTTDPWQTFNASSSGTSGELVSWFDPTAAFGRLDPITTSAGTSGEDPVPIFTHAYGSAGGTFGRVLLDDRTTKYFVTVAPVSPTALANVTLSFASRTITDLGTIAIGATANVPGLFLDASNTPAYVLFHVTDTATSAITVHPHVPASLDTEFQAVDATELPASALFDTTAIGDDTGTISSSDGWNALVIRAVTAPASSQLFDVTVAR